LLLFSIFYFNWSTPPTRFPYQLQYSPPYNQSVFGNLKDVSLDIFNQTSPNKIFPHIRDIELLRPLFRSIIGTDSSSPNRFYGLLSITDPFQGVEEKKIGESFHRIIRYDGNFTPLVRFMTEGTSSGPFHALNQRSVLNFILNLDTIGLVSDRKDDPINTKYIATIVRLYLTQVVNSYNSNDKVSLPNHNNNNNNNNNNPFMFGNPPSTMIHKIMGYDKLLNSRHRQARSPNPDRNTDFLSLDQNISELMFLTVEAFIIQLIAEDAVGGNDMSDAPRLLDAIANFNNAVSTSGKD
jgi:hypothetical protein